MSITHPQASTRSMILVMLGFLTLNGCSTNPQGEFPRFDLTGTVTYDRTPIPIGIIRILPDQSKGNRGPGSSCRIVDGKYQTPSGQGTVSGPVIVQILGFADQKELEHGERPLFPSYQTEAIIPVDGGQMDFDIPVQHKKK